MHTNIPKCRTLMETKFRDREKEEFVHLRPCCSADVLNIRCCSCVLCIYRSVPWRLVPLLDLVRRYVSVQKRCLPAVIDFGFRWPSSLNCSRFESKSEEGKNCIELPNIPNNPGGSRGQNRPRKSTTKIPLDLDIQRSILNTSEQTSKSTMFSTDIMNSNLSINPLENTSVVDLTTFTSSIDVQKMIQQIWVLKCFIHCESYVLLCFW